MSGALAALRASDRAGMGYELMDNTRAGLLDGILTLVISHPLERLSDEVMSGMIKALTTRAEGRTSTTALPFDMYTRENITRWRLTRNVSLADSRPSRARPAIPSFPADEATPAIRPKPKFLTEPGATNPAPASPGLRAPP
ncbi:MAG: hypothetical protein JO312_11200 [Hyphomicrobiales bacterium]|nr:hypothetical protein [Hyphomicrobiales bacterium]